MTTAVYDEIGKTYDRTRKADPKITKQLIQHLSPIKEGCYLDIGCGSGNYTLALFENGLRMCGLDISDEMLEKARKKSSLIDWISGDAQNLPFSSNQFEGVTCILATHHIKDIESFFTEVFRVLEKGNFVIFTSFPEQMEAYWLNRYFPNMIRLSSSQMYSYEQVFAALSSAGFNKISTEKYFVTDDLQDYFLQSGKHRPHLYLDPVIRSGISSFALEKNEEEIVKGCDKLRDDIFSGEINNVIKAHESHLGDYVFVVATKE